MKEPLSLGEMIDALLLSPSLTFIDTNNEWTAFIDIHEILVFQKFIGQRITTLSIDDKDKMWVIKSESN